MKKQILRIGIFIFLVAGSYIAAAQELQRPSIWVKKSDREKIIKKIQEEPWAKNYYQEFKKRIDTDIDPYLKDPDAFLRLLPFDYEQQKTGRTPPFHHIAFDVGNNRPMAIAMMRYLQIAIDCGVVYYISEDKQYAQCATDILNAFTQAMVQMQIDSTSFNGGYMYVNDHLREAREVGAQIPLVYDFIYPFITSGGKAYDIGSGKMIPFPKEQAQQIFHTYIYLALNHGIIDCNWPVLESPSLVQNILALDDTHQRDSLLRFYLTLNTPHQDALKKVAETFESNNGMWPETTGYASAVSNFSTYLMTLLTRYDPSLHLGREYPLIPLSLDSWNDFRYPNGELIAFGDASRKKKESYLGYEQAYTLGKVDGVDTLVNKYGSLIKSAIANGEYQRDDLSQKRSFAPDIYMEPTRLLWGQPQVEGAVSVVNLPRTITLPHAGILLQRNISKFGNPSDDLMCFVGGGHFVHAHASGMNIELYGRGYILGVAPGTSTYGTDFHNNYTKQFAAHNTVIENGSSQTSGGWINLGINQVKEVAIEPRPFEEGVSPNYSFTISSFIDDKFNGANPVSLRKEQIYNNSSVDTDRNGPSYKAIQERTLSIVRTSAHTGYYVDVFRTRSNFPDQYHDYIYHNIGDELTFLNDDLTLRPDPERYMANATKPLPLKRPFRYPGWHYFTDINTSGSYSGDVQALFRAKFIGGHKVNMKLFIPGSGDREYTKVMAPITGDAPVGYEKKKTPTLVIRKKGEAWDQPFVVVYEPIEGDHTMGSVRSVEKLAMNGVFTGLKISSIIDDNTIVQYVLVGSGNVSDKLPGLVFDGKYAVITVKGNDEIQNIYIGDGQHLQFKNIDITAKDKKDIAVDVDITTVPPTIQTKDRVQVMLGGKIIR